MLRIRATAILVGTCLLLFAAFTRWQRVAERPLIVTDGRGYYAYLPAAFLYHDFTYGFTQEMDSLHYAGAPRSDFFHVTPHGSVNKYFVGTAVLIAPFFAGAAVVSRAMDFPVDGYSPPFQIGTGVAALSYLTIGLLLLGAFLHRLRFGSVAIIFTLLLLALGTNLLFYSLYEPSMSHVYSFCMVAGFLYCSSLAILDGRTRLWPIISLFLALIVLIRPTNGLIALALPVVAGGTVPFLQSIESLLRRPGIFLLAAFVFIAVVAFQPLMYLVQVGKPFYWSYLGEGFDFTSPEILNVLFSYRRGLFVYAPVLLLAVTGILAMRRRDPERSSWLLVVLGLTTYIISSWWMWWYGGGFGHRAFIEYFPLFAIGLAFILQNGWGLLRPSLVAVLGVLCIGFQGVQTYQFTQDILPFDDIDRKIYHALFLRTGKDLVWYHMAHPGKERYSATDSIVMRHDMESRQNWGGEEHMTDRRSFLGNGSSCIGAETVYGASLRIRAGDVPVSANIVRVSGMVWSESWSSDVMFVCTIQDSTGTGYSWAARPLRPQFTFGQDWHYCTGVFFTGPVRSPDDVYLIYLMKNEAHEVCVDDFEITFIHAD